MRERNATAAQKHRAVDLYYQHESSTIVGELVGWDPATVMDWVRQHQAGRVFVGEEEPGPSGWRDRAACAGAPHDWFFVEPGNRSKEAKALCGACPVQPDCLDYALVMRLPYGVFGGMTIKERLAYRREQESKVA